MRAFLLRRALHAVFVLWGVVSAVFFLVRLTGDPTPFLVDQTATQQEIAEARTRLGLDRALHVQYLDFLRSVPRGDFGTSIREKRPAMQMVLEQDYVRTARAKWLAERFVIYRHALRNAAIPVITVTGLSLGFMLSGAVIIETVFSWPGMGRLIVQAVPGRDFPVIQAGVFVFALIFVGLNLIVDLLYTMVDPRVRLT